ALNYVKTKLKLEMMDAGERLEVWLDAGEPIKNVPMSLKNDGHKVLLEEALEPAAAHYRVLVEKVEGCGGGGCPARAKAGGAAGGGARHPPGVPRVPG